MAINRYNIKKFVKMVFGKSILHVKQDIGKSFSKKEIKGYYNDLTLKVSKSKISIDSLPVYEYEQNKYVQFPIAIIQYGLGAYDLFLLTSKQEFKTRFYNAVNWIEEKIKEDGSIDTFGFLHENAPYSAMAQGEAASLLLRAYIDSNDKKYLYLAIKLIDFMITPLEKGGVAIYKDDKIYLKEYTNKPVVLNGFIFSMWGLYDLLKINQEEKYQRAFNMCLKGLIDILPNYDLGYWSKYDNDKKISSPFYHSLHIAQLKCLYILTENDIFDEYARKFRKYQKNIFYKAKAFVTKVRQKVHE